MKITAFWDVTTCRFLSSVFTFRAREENRVIWPYYVWNKDVESYCDPT
jgi:hypothetical protein